MPARRVLPKAAILAFWKSQRASGGEELGVLGIGAGPAAFDVVDAQLVELLRDLQLVLDGEGDALHLGAVAERRVVKFDFHLRICLLLGIVVIVRRWTRRRRQSPAPDEIGGLGWPFDFDLTFRCWAYVPSTLTYRRRATEEQSLGFGLTPSRSNG